MNPNSPKSKPEEKSKPLALPVWAKKIQHSPFGSKLKNAYKKWGWKAVIAIFIYYLVRDVTLYVIIPALVIKKSFDF